jgi:hypothetical protein
MWWYIAFSIIFTIYAVDLLFLFTASLFATVVEHFAPPISTAACRAAKRHARKEAAKQQQLASVDKAKASDGGKNPEMSIMVDTRAGMQVSERGSAQV